MSSLARFGAASFVTGAALLTFAVVAAGACAVVDKPIAFEEGGTTVSAPPFVEPDAEAVPIVPMCVSTECPSPYATCPAKFGLCNVNLNIDVDNCGACDNKCQFLDEESAPLNARLSCENGKCGALCDPETGDCNAKLEDGCETRLEADPLNCGACGNACKDGEICWRSVCGCPPGYTQCGNTCTQLDRDPNNCSACGTLCGLPDADAGSGAWPCEPGVLPPHVGPVCSNSECKLDCSGDFFGSYRDCNGDLCGDGCETNVSNDPKNCGGCGHACLAEQVCIDGECKCDDSQLTYCGKCTDLMRDPDNCGSCGHACPGQRTPWPAKSAGRPICVLGRCAYSCPPDRADCDHRIENGCEIDLMVDPQNCGGCGQHCALEGQPCAAGSCLTKPCDGDGGVH